MTQKDWELIEKAKELSFFEWSLINPNEAETEEGREALENIKHRKLIEEQQINILML